MVDKPQNGQDALTKMIVKDLVAGYNFGQIADNMGIPEIDVVKRWREYMTSRTVMDRAEQWTLMLLRLEDLYQKAHDRIIGSTDMEDFKFILPILESIEKLQGLNEARKTELGNEIATLSKQQGELMAMAFQQFAVLMKGYVDNALEARTIKGIKENLGDWDEVVMETTEKALTVVEENNHAE